MNKIFLMGFVLIISYVSLFSAEGKKRWNILYVMSDDHSYQTIGAYGGRFKDISPTPTIDKLAKEGLRFDRCYVGNSICGPARATVLTGKHSHKNGYYDNNRSYQFDGSQMTFPKELQKEGYQTAIIGKWHLGSMPTGFDYYEILPGQGEYFNPGFIKNGKAVSYEGYVTNVTCDLALNWLKKERKSDKPFMLMLQFKAPHRPFQPDPKYANYFDNVKFPEPENLYDTYNGKASAIKNQKLSILSDMDKMDLKMKGFKKASGEDLSSLQKSYAYRHIEFEKVKDNPKALLAWKYQMYMRDYMSCIKSIDEQLGRVIKYLEETGLAKNTVVFYTSDQGFYMGEHGWFDKRFMYEESFRTPLIIYYPEMTKGTSTKKLTQNIDIAPTILAIADAKIPEDVQGVSLLPLIRGEDPKDWRKSLYYHYYEFPRPHHAYPHEGVILEDEKLINFYINGEKEYYNLNRDPAEMDNGYNKPENKERIKLLEKELINLRKKYDVPSNESNPKFIEALKAMRRFGYPIADEYKSIKTEETKKKKN